MPPRYCQIEKMNCLRTPERQNLQIIKFLLILNRAYAPDTAHTPLDNNLYLAISHNPLVTKV